MTRPDDGDVAPLRALGQMARSVVPVEGRERADARRARLLPALTEYADDVFAHAPRRSLRPSWKSVVAVAAALSSIALVAAAYEWRAGRLAGAPALRASEGAVRVTHDGATSDAARSTPLDLGAHDTVATGDGHAEVSLASGASVALGEASRVELDAVGQSGARSTERLVLVAGHIDVHVPKLPPGSSLVVGTPDALVTVHGTAFTVDVRPGGAGVRPTTVVGVTEGRVSVQSRGREIFLGPGAHWSSAAADPAALEPASAVEDEAPTGSTPDVAPSRAGSAPRATPSSAGAPGTTAERRSTLAAETELLRSAMAARRTGNPTLALELLERLVSAYPASPLRPEALRERVRAEDDLARRAR